MSRFSLQQNVTKKIVYFHIPSALCVCRWSFVCRSSITYSLSLSLALSPASHQEQTHIMASDEEGSEYLSDGGDAVASRQRKHGRDERDSMQKISLLFSSLLFSSFLFSSLVVSCLVFSSLLLLSLFSLPFSSLPFPLPFPSLPFPSLLPSPFPSLLFFRSVARIAGLGVG